MTVRNILKQFMDSEMWAMEEQQLFPVQIVVEAKEMGEPAQKHVRMNQRSNIWLRIVLTISKE